MVIESKRIFTLAISALVICLAISFVITSAVFVSGCVGGGKTCNASNETNCTTSQACLVGICTATCIHESNCNTTIESCRRATSDAEKGSKTNENAYFCLSSLSKITTSTTTTPSCSVDSECKDNKKCKDGICVECKSTGDCSSPGKECKNNACVTITTAQINPNAPVVKINNSLLKSTVYVVDPLNVKIGSDIDIKIELNNKGNIDIFKDASTQGNVILNKPKVAITNTNGCTFDSNAVQYYDSSINKGSAENVTFTLNIANKKIGESAKFNYKVKVLEEGDFVSNIQVSNILLSKSDFKVILRNESGGYNIMIPGNNVRLDYKPLIITFTKNKDTVCSGNTCTKEYNVTFTLTNDAIADSNVNIKGYDLVIKDIISFGKEGGDVPVLMTPFSDIVFTLNKTNNNYTISGVNFTVSDISSDWFGDSDNEEKFTIQIGTKVKTTLIPKYVLGEGLDTIIYVNYCTSNNDCESNNICKDGRCVIKDSSGGGGQ